MLEYAEIKEQTISFKSMTIRGSPLIQSFQQRDLEKMMLTDTQTPSLTLRAPKTPVDLGRLWWTCLGGMLFILVYYSPPWPDAIDPMGNIFPLTREAKGALAMFFLASIWWIFEVVPIGVTSLTIGILQALFLIRPAKEAFRDFMDPSVLFIFGSIVIGTVFTKTGLTRRIICKILLLVGEKTSMIYLGCFALTCGLTHFMAHTAVAATMYPLLMAVYSLYSSSKVPTQFGKGLFIGMAYIAGAGSIVTLLGAARGAVALGFYKDIMGREVSFFELSLYMAPVGWLMAIALWIYIMIILKPEKNQITGLKEKVKRMHSELGQPSKHEIFALVIIGLTILTISLRSFLPSLQALDKSAILLSSTVAFYLAGILDLDDLEEIPWNIILLFSGAMSIGFCLWNTGAASWLAVEWLSMFQNSHWLVFVMSIAFFVMIMTNFIMNVAAITISLPVALVIAPYLNVAGEVILFTSLATAGMPFLLLVGAAPNAIAYSSGQFTTKEFFKYGIPASLLLMLVMGFAIVVIWPLLGMPITL